MFAYTSSTTCPFCWEVNKRRDWFLTIIRIHGSNTGTPKRTLNNKTMVLSIHALIIIWAFYLFSDLSTLIVTCCILYSINSFLMVIFQAKHYIILTSNASNDYQYMIIFIQAESVAELYGIFWNQTDYILIKFIFTLAQHFCRTLTY